jgi:predicted transcriptional regulator
MSTKLKENQLLAIPLVAQGVSGKEIAKQLSVAEETVSRWKQTPEFQAEVNAILLECRDNAKQQLRNLLTNSLNLLEAEMNNPESRHKVNIALKMLQLVRIHALVHEDIGPVNPDIVQKIKEDKEFKDLFLSG